MTNATLQDEVAEPEQVYRWLRLRADELKLNVRFDFERVRVRENWLFVPYDAPGEDIADRAHYLDELQDEYLERRPVPNWELLLIPS